MKKIITLIIATLTILLLPTCCFASHWSVTPVISSITPTSTTPGTITETLNGSNFYTVRSVAVYNATTRTFVSNASFSTSGYTKITATVNLAAGSYYFRVNTNVGTSNNSPTLTLAAGASAAPAPPASAPAPAISSVSPTISTAGAFNETITGSNFTNVQKVAVYNASTGSSVSNPTFTVNSSSQISAAVNLAAGSYFIQATTASGTSNNSPTLQVTAASSGSGSSGSGSTGSGSTGSYSVKVLSSPISSTPILPTGSVSAPTASQITISACPDQYQSASFVVTAGSADVVGLLASPSVLISGTNTIPASAVNIRTVKCWYQSAGWHSNQMVGPKTLVPELLLKNDGLVRVDLSGQNNYLELAGGGELLISGSSQATPNLIQPTDAVDLQPVTVPAGQSKQFWVTVHVPPGTPAGTYAGAIGLTAGGSTQNVNISLTVYGFTLEQPSMIYGMIYEGKQNSQVPNGQYGGVIDAPWKSATQYAYDINNMKIHGIDHPGLDQYWENGAACQGTMLDADMAARDKAGLPKDYLLFYTPECGYAGSVPSTSTWDAVLTWIKAAGDGHGYAHTVAFGADEAGNNNPNDLSIEIPSFKETHAKGCLQYIATDTSCNPWSIVGQYGYVDIVNCSFGYQTPSQVAQWHSKNIKVFNYAMPQTAWEDPYPYRLNYGAGLYHAGYDGTFICAYQQNYTKSGGSIWNDFMADPAQGNYRNHCITYPTANAAIDTVAFEGLREGINDVRYLTTLQKAISAHPGQVATAAQAWLNGINPNGDLDAMRAQAASYIQQLLQ